MREFHWVRYGYEWEPAEKVSKHDIKGHNWYLFRLDYSITDWDLAEIGPKLEDPDQQLFGDMVCPN